MERNHTVSQKELERQKEYMARMRELNENFFAENGRRRKMHITTFGCQMNAHDSEKAVASFIQNFIIKL